MLKKVNLKNILILILLVLCLVFGFSYFSEKNETRIDEKLITNRIENVKELTSLKYSYTNMGEFENSNKFYGYDIPFTQKKFIVAYDGTISCGVNLDDMDVDVSGKNINIKIPHSQIISHEIYEDSLKVFDQKNSIFNLIEVEDYNNFAKDQKDKMEKKAVDRGLLENADEKCKNALIDIINIDNILEDYEINIEFK